MLRRFSSKIVHLLKNRKEIFFLSEFYLLQFQLWGFYLEEMIFLICFTYDDLVYA